MGEESQGMVLAVDDKDGKVNVIELSENVDKGIKVR
jgi:tRNA-binding EMAP/Myf-like protein